ncbi:MAG: DMT family transporter [Coxiellaceae bacterium]|nr:DMT family transporter [Coxiellaceae bacterium]
MNKELTRKYGLLVGISLIWGSQFLFNAVALQQLPPLVVAVLRAAIGVVTLTAVLPLFDKKEQQPCGRGTTSIVKYYPMFFIIGIFEATLPFYLVAWGQQHVDSSTAAILMSTIPLFTIIMVAIFIRDEKITSNKIVSVIVGFIGILILLGPEAMQHLDNLMANLVGEIAILAGALSFALSLILIKKVSHLNHVRSARNILVCATIQLLPFAIFTSDLADIHFSYKSAVAILVLGIFAAGIVYAMYVSLIKMAGAAFTSLNSYLLPVIGLILGVIFMHDPTYWYTFVALAILLLAMAINEYPLIKQAITRKTHKRDS